MISILDDAEGNKNPVSLMAEFWVNSTEATEYLIAKMIDRALNTLLFDGVEYPRIIAAQKTFSNSMIA